jgi:hypothetical protein
MDSQGTGQREVFKRRFRAKNGVRKLTVASMAVGLDLSVKAAVTRLWMAQS